MIPVIVMYLLFSSIFLFSIPTFRSRVLGVVYLLLILLFIWGIGGLIFSGKPTSNEIYVFYAFYIFILGIHIPLILKLHQTDVKKHPVKSARQILGKDIQHLSEHELHHRLNH